MRNLEKNNETGFAMAPGTDFYSRIPMSDIPSVQGNRSPVVLECTTDMVNSESSIKKNLQYAKRQIRQIKVIQYSLFIFLLLSAILTTRSVYKIFFLSLFLMTGCKTLTPQQESQLSQVGIAILCSIEQLELDDPALNKLCGDIVGRLTPEQRAALEGQTARMKAAKANKPKTECGQ